MCPECKFCLVFDEKIDGPGLEAAFKKQGDVIVEIEEEDESDEELSEDELNLQQPNDNTADVAPQDFDQEDDCVQIQNEEV